VSTYCLNLHLYLTLILLEFLIIPPTTSEEIAKLVSHSSDAYCDLDPIPISILKQCASALIPNITKIINLSISTGVFPGPTSFQEV
jgi:hypothetical protein